MKLKDRIKGIKAGKDPAKLDEEQNSTPEHVPYSPYTPEELGYDPKYLDIK